MTNEQLKAFLAVAEQGSFRKAAKTIFKTQAAVSASIKSLEERYGVQMFNRDEYRPTLTEAGKAFYNNAKITMNHFQRLDQIGHQLTKGVEPEFTIVVSIAVDLPPLLAKIKSITSQFSNTQFRIHTESLHGVVERIDDNRADLAFGPALGLNIAHEKLPIAKVNFINVAAPDYFPPSTNYKFTLEEIAEYAQIVTRDSATHSTKASFHTLPNREAWNVHDFMTKKELIKAGFGWGSIPEHLINDELKQGLLVPIHVEGIPLKASGELFMFRNRNHHHGLVSQKLWDQLNLEFAVE
ncbi:LysR family transcriptional regulator [Vibrio europaeus]|uniref:LysR family transcriptional regulator n=1 Tax=Vibrio europaeus TaxID=300876 RepID=UPI00233E76CD|nr:LysR family transcriptional regulator [Vibrio europaeus]MDC5856766.1 LysR family transcriptional regulator [Vibrio europaeus]